LQLLQKVSGALRVCGGLKDRTPIAAQHGLAR
jgi:hypothetical protein